MYEPESLVELAPYMTILYPRDTVPLREWQSQFWKPGEQVETFSLLPEDQPAHLRDVQIPRRDEAGVQTPAEDAEKKQRLVP